MSTYPMRTRKLWLVVPIFSASVIFILLIQLLAKPLPKLSSLKVIEATAQKISPPVRLGSKALTVATRQSDSVAAISPISPKDDLQQPNNAAVLIRINGRALSLEEWKLTQSADRAMNQLLAISNDAEALVALDRVINQELAWQAARTSGFGIEEGEIQQTLQQLLADHSRSEFDLEAALATQQVDRSFFTTYLRRMITADRFVNQEVSKILPATKSTDDFLQQLRTQAQISFGPAFASLAQITPKSTITNKQPAQPVAITPATNTTTAEIFPILTLKPIAIKPATDQQAVQQSSEISDDVASTDQPNVAEPTTPRGTNPGELPPYFALPRLDNSEKVSLDDFLGKALVLSFWVTWCPYCQQQTPILIEGAARYTKANVQFIGINVKEDPATVQYFVDQQPFGYPILLDPDGSSAAQFHVSGFPVTYFLDHNGLIAAQHAGALSAELLDSYLEPLLD